jgi:hypothetical protein
MPRLPEAGCFWQAKTVAVRSRQLPVMDITSVSARGDA